MSTDEVFVNPTVKQVVFQIKFPSLFYIEAKIGEYQMDIMKSFPKSEVVVRRQFILADVTKGQVLDEMPESGARKIWKFTSDSGVVLELQADSLTLSSEHYSSYASGVLEEQFREVIHFAVGTFLDVTRVPILDRIGLRYVDHCPIKSTSNMSFSRLYASCLPIRRFPLHEVTDAAVGVVVTLDKGYGLTYKEQYVPRDHKLILDIDAYYGPLSNPVEYLSIADELHVITSREFWLTAKEPLKDYMRSAKRGA